MTLYLTDTDVLIEAHQTFYAFDLCPGFWDFLDREGANGEMRSIREVRLELEVPNDALSGWAHARVDTFFLEPTPESVAAMQRVSNWAIGTPYTEAAKREFLAAADSYLIAYALALGATVVTLETPNQPGQLKRIKLPTACAAFDVPCERPFDVLRRRGLNLVL